MSESAPPRRRSRWFAVVAGLTLLALAAGAIVFGPHLVPVATGAILSAGAAARPTPSPTTSPAPVAFTGDLRTLLVPRPATAKTWVLPGWPADGRLTASSIALLSSDPGRYLDLLDKQGYQRGAWTGWIQTDQTAVTIELHQFADSLGAREWMALERQNMDRSPDYGPTSDIPGVRGGWYDPTREASAEGYWTIAGYFTRNDIAVDVWVQSRRKADTELIVALCQRQHGLLG